MNVWILVGGITVLFGVMVFGLSPARNAETYSVEGIFVDCSMYQDFPIKGKGQKTNVNLHFNVGQQKPIAMTRKNGESDPIPGMKVKIFYQLGRIFHNRVYLNYEWIN